jgi:hypothetical protein
MTESELYRDLGLLTRDKWKESICSIANDSSSTFMTKFAMQRSSAISRVHIFQRFRGDPCQIFDDPHIGRLSILHVKPGEESGDMERDAVPVRVS